MADPTDFSWARLALACFTVLALMAGLAVGLKYIGTRGLSLPLANGKKRRLQIAESLTVDTKRRILILKCDGREHLLLLGGQQDIVIDTNLPRPPIEP